MEFPAGNMIILIFLEKKHNTKFIICGIVKQRGLCILYTKGQYFMYAYISQIKTQIKILICACSKANLQF